MNIHQIRKTSPCWSSTKKIQIAEDLFLEPKKPLSADSIICICQGQLAYSFLEQISRQPPNERKTFMEKNMEQYKQLEKGMRGFIRKNIKNYKFAHHSILSGQLLQDFQNQKNEILSESLTETPLISEEKPPKEQKKQVMPQKKEKKKVSFAKNFANDIIDIQSFKK